MAGEPRLPPTDDRLADPEEEGLVEEDPERVPDDERVVPEDVNEYVPGAEPDEFGPG
jgi:hypothetical protein